jgi:predicted phosphohydrolase
MIYIIGDRHGEEDGFSEQKLPGQSLWTSDDTVIVTGDFGYVMRGEWNNLPEKNKLNALAQKPYTILFCDGNHEGFDYLEQYPQEVRYGAPVCRIRDNVFWLQRGYIYTIEGKTFFVMGGAYSVDKAFRMSYQEICGEKIWFEQELPSPEEYRRAIQNLEANNNTVDYVITHTAPRSMIPRIIHSYPDDHDRELTGFFEWIYHDIHFTHWYLGHFHCDMHIGEQITVCYEAISELPKTGT